MSSIVLTGDTSGTITVSAPAVAGTRTLTLPAATGTAILEDASGVLQMNSGYGSLAPAYGCRAWVNFNGTGTVAIRESKNVSSITDDAVGKYTVNFTTAMVDANYAVTASGGRGNATETLMIGNKGTTAPTASSVSLSSQIYTGAWVDVAYGNIAILR